ncbi:MAG TPA: nickel pincer cofactor biosynthesis protein LarB [Planctomycetota bacterium]|nr:nickel pincer cofactor biosynthesis protein LarB [Planctomycetota bacterium]
MRPPFEQLAADLAAGRLGDGAGLDALAELHGDALGFARLDHERPARSGLPEVVYGAGKTAEQIVAIVARLKRRGHPVLVTRLSPEVHAACGRDLDAGHERPGDFHALSRTWCWSPAPVADTGAGTIVVACAGTSDLPVAEEAARTLELFGNRVERLADVGVAGLHRLVEHLPRLRSARAIVVVAGMEGALPSVVGGLVACPVIAVPTSVGYGASFGGLAALLAMLNSCAAGITVVNIDNGFGAACAAHLINHPVTGDAQAPAGHDDAPVPARRDPAGRDGDGA